LKHNPFVSVIILNYNCRKFLDKCLSSLLNTNYSGYQVVLVDNKSCDRSVEFVLQKFDNRLIKVIELDKNYGFAVGNNIGAKYVSGDYLIFLNPDTQVDPDWLKNMVYVLENDSSIGIAQPKLLLMDKKHFDSAGGYINSHGLVWTRGSGERDIGQYEKVEEIFYAKGAALMIRQNLWKRLGGFDPIFFMYDEETDLCWRVWDSGYKVAYIPSAKVYHVGGSVVKKVPYNLKYHEARGRLILLIKNHSLVDVFRCVPMTIILHILNVMKHALKGDGLTTLAITKGTFWCLFNFKNIWLARKIRVPQHNSRKLALENMVKRLLVW